MRKDSEFGLLCCIARNDKTIAECESEGLMSADFADPVYRYMYGHAYKLWQADTSVDEVTWREKATGLDKLLEGSGVSAKKLFDRMFRDTVVSQDNVPVFIAEVMEASVKSTLTEKISGFKSRMDDMTSADIIAGMEDITQNTQRRFMTERPHTIGGGSKLFDKLVAREQKQLSGLALPWQHVNERISGLADGTTTLWIAPTGTGKTAAMNNIMNKTCYDDKLHALNIGVEMPPDIMMLRQVALRSGVTERDLRLNKNWQTADKTKNAVLKACTEMDSLDTYHYLFMPEFSISKIRGHAIRAKSQWDIKLLIFDYISEPEDASNKKQEWQNMSQFMWRVAVLSKTLMIPAIVVGQTTLIVSRDYMTLEDIALAKYMSFHCDHVIGQINKTDSTMTAEKEFRDAPGDMGNQKAYILKGRHGGDDPGGLKHRYINLNYTRSCLRIQEGLYPCYDQQKTL